MHPELSDIRFRVPKRTMPNDSESKPGSDDLLCGKGKIGGGTFESNEIETNATRSNDGRIRGRRGIGASPEEDEEMHQSSFLGDIYTFLVPTVPKAKVSMPDEDTIQDPIDHRGSSTISVHRMASVGDSFGIGKSGSTAGFPLVRVDFRGC